jgi:hypothetical protein
VRFGVITDHWLAGPVTEVFEPLPSSAAEFRSANAVRTGEAAHAVVLDHPYFISTVPDLLHSLSPPSRSALRPHPPSPHAARFSSSRETHLQPVG